MTTAAAPRNPTRGEAVVQGFASSGLTPPQLMRRAAPLLNSKKLLQSVLGLTLENQARFVDKIDQVRRDHLSSPL